MPIIATILALKFLFNTIDGLVGSLPERLFGRNVPGIGVIVTALVVLLMGLLAGNYLGKKIIAIGEKFFTSIPLVSSIYTAAKEFMQAVTLSTRMPFKEVVMVPYPHPGRFAYAFITSRVERRGPQGSEKIVNVFIPTTPVITTGFLIAFPESEIIHVNISVEKAIKLLVSGGIVAPKIINEIPGSSNKTATQPDKKS